jgi:hypothetical protein
MTGELLAEDLGGDGVLRRHRRQCVACADLLAFFLDQERELREAMLLEAARRIRGEVARRSRLRLLLGWGMGLAASLLVVSVVSWRGSREWTTDGAEPAGSWISSTRPRTLRIDGRVTASLQRGTVRSDGATGLELLEGRLDVEVTPGSGPFDVKTPAGVVAVRGTRFIVDVRNDREGGIMDRRFWLGLSAGVTTTVVVLTGKVLLTGSGGEAEVGAGHVASVRSGQRPSAPQTVSERLLKAENELREAREGERKSLEQLAFMQARADQLETLLSSFGQENSELQGRVEEALKASRSGAEAQSKRAREEELGNLRVRLRIGEELSEDAVRWLGLDGGQRQVVNALLKEDGVRMYAVLRQTIAEDPLLTAPPDNGPEVLGALVASKAFMADLRKLPEMTGSGGKTMYLEEHMGVSSPFVRMAERLQSARQMTLDGARGLLAEEQHAKLVSLLGTTNYSFGGAQLNLGPNVQVRRPK